MSLKVTKFSAVWCAPCQALGPIFDKVAGSTDGVEFVHVDIDEEPERTSAAGVRSVPTIVFEKDGVVKDTMVGLVKEQAIRDKIEQLR